MLAAIWLGGALAAADAPAPWRSELYPVDWKPPEVVGGLRCLSDRFLHDFSYAGFAQGAEAIPTVAGPVVKPDGLDRIGDGDATALIQAAIDRAGALAKDQGRAVVQLPVGTFFLSAAKDGGWALRLPDSGVVLRGAGRGRTVLIHRRAVLRDAVLIDIGGNGVMPAPARSVAVAVDAVGPTVDLVLAGPPPWKVGDRVVVESDMTDAAVAEVGMTEGWGGHDGGLSGPRALRTVVAVEGNRVRIDVPTRWPVLMRDRGRITDAPPMPTRIGLEDLSLGDVEDPRRDGWAEGDHAVAGTAGHDAHNAWLVRLRHAEDCWIRRVDSAKAPGNVAAHLRSNGIQVLRSRTSTIDDVHLSDAQYGGAGGNGYLIRIQHSNEILVRHVRLERCRHPFVFSHMGSSGNVITACQALTSGVQTAGTGKTSGRGSDHHMWLSHANLVEDSDSDGDHWEAVFRPYGATIIHGQTASMTVFWNLRGDGAGKDLVRSSQFGWGYVIGTSGPRAAVSALTDPRTAPVDHVEGVGRPGLVPSSLWADQVQRRLGHPPR